MKPIAVAVTTSIKYGMFSIKDGKRQSLQMYRCNDILFEKEIATFSSIGSTAGKLESPLHSTTDKLNIGEMSHKLVMGTERTAFVT